MGNLASNQEWKKWGELDPLFGVAAWPDKQRGGTKPWTNQQFYQLGRSDWEDFVSHWEKYGVNRDSCLEIGCGAGRITKQLGSYFNHVHAIDVSDKMLEYAKSNIPSASVAFYLSNGVDIPLAAQSVSSVFSTHVFQHFDSLSVADRYFAEIARTMKPGGTLMIHLPVYIWPSKYRIFRILYALQKTIGDMRARLQRALMRHGMANPGMRGLGYPLQYLYEVLPMTFPL